MHARSMDGFTDTYISRGPVRLPPGSSLVTDAEEEIFSLYTNLASKTSDGSTNFRGLGHIDSHKDTICITFEQKHSHISERPTNGTKLSKRSKRRGTQPEWSLEVEIAQDKTALHSRKGDTGSVLWKASVDFADFILQQHHARPPNAFLDPSLLLNSHVLELGAGTGLLSVVLTSLVGRYTVTDIDPLIPLIERNLALNAHATPAEKRPRKPGQHISPSSSIPAKVVAQPLDWELLHKTSPQLRRNVFDSPPVDLLLIVDCIYHPSLLPALLSTIDYLTVPGRTTVLIVVELRAEDVIREFLEGWLKLSPTAWEIWSVSGVIDGPYAVWVGWKKIEM